MELSKHVSFFDPLKVESQIHIIGLGALGSNLAHQLVRLGVHTLHLYDFDVVEIHNITNQTHREIDLNETKLNALDSQLREINPKVKIIPHPKGWEPGANLRGYVFLCVDSIELRYKILDENYFNPFIEFVTDMRIGLEEAQMYSAKWQEQKHRERILSTMQFKDDEVVVPVSACGTQLTVLPTIQMIVSLGTMNFINFSKTGLYNYQSVIDSVQGIATSYKD